MNITNQDELAIRKLHDDVVSAFNENDLERILSLHTADVTLIDPNLPVIIGKKEVIRLFYEFKRQDIVLKLGFDLLQVEVVKDKAFVRGKVKKTTIQNGGTPVYEEGKFVSISQKQKDGTWLRSHVIANSGLPNEEE